MSHNIDQIELFNEEKALNIEMMGNNLDLQKFSIEWMIKSAPYKYSYNFCWLGRPIIQFPQDIVALQELIWMIKPDLIIETGIAHGGSLVLSASMLALLDMEEAIKCSNTINPRETCRKVLGIDIDIRSYNRFMIEEHPMSSRIQMIHGSSIEPDIVSQVKQVAKGFKCILICLDSMHTHDHVLAELEVYAPLTSRGSYCIVYDTSIENVPDEMFLDRPWTKRNNPKTAVWEFLKHHPEFEIDKSISNKLLITSALDGYLKRNY